MEERKKNIFKRISKCLKIFRYSIEIYDRLVTIVDLLHLSNCPDEDGWVHFFMEEAELTIKKIEK